MKHANHLVMVLAAVTFCVPCFGEHRKIAKDLEGADPQNTVDVIVQFKQLGGSNALWGTTTTATAESANLLVQGEK